MQLELPEDHWMLPVLGAMALSSSVIWLWILVRKVQGRAIVPLAPRTPVPWSAMATLLAVVMALFALLGLASSENGQFEELPVEESTQQLVQSMLLILSLTAVVLFLVVATSKATWHDLGLPESLPGLIRDCGLGTAGFLAALVPVYGMQAALVYGLEEPSQHPLIEKILSDPDPMLLTVAFITAAVVAPICEEIAFRLLLQGWLEKRWLKKRDARSEEFITDTGSIVSVRQADGEVGFTSDETTAPPERARPDDDSALRTPHSAVALRSVLVSSMVFAVAHVGHGPDPIAIFLLALILGYLYQRTHRIVPCIVTHMLFNSFSLVVLITVIFAQK